MTESGRPNSERVQERASVLKSDLALDESPLLNLDEETPSLNWLDLLGWTEEEIGDLRFVGYSYLNQGLYKTALKFFEALVVLCPESAYDLQTAGALHLQLGDNLTALSYFDRALKFESDHPTTLLNRAKALLLLGYHRQGLAQLIVLSNQEDPYIKGQAEALTLAYT